METDRKNSTLKDLIRQTSGWDDLVGLIQFCRASIRNMIMLFIDHGPNISNIKEELDRRSQEHQARERGQEHIRDMIRQFIESQPRLMPTRFGIPEERYDLLAFMCAVDSLGVLLNNHAALVLNDLEADVLMYRDGSIASTKDGSVLIDSKAICLEIYRAITPKMIIPKPMRTLNQRKMIETRERLVSYHERDAQKFVSWLHEALRVQPHLMYDHEAQNRGDFLRIVRLPADEEPLTAQERWSPLP